MIFVFLLQDARPILDKLEEEKNLLDLFQRLVQETGEKDMEQEILDNEKLVRPLAIITGIKNSFFRVI